MHQGLACMGNATVSHLPNPFATWAGKKRSLCHIMRALTPRRASAKGRDRAPRPPGPPPPPAEERNLIAQLPHKSF